MKTAVALFALALAAFALAACGDDGGTSAETTDQGAAQASNRSAFEEAHPGSARYGSPPLEFEADPEGGLAYTADEVIAKEGNVTIEFTNPQSVAHNVVVEDTGVGRVKTATISDGDFAAVTVTLSREGEFIFYCSVPGHREAGMEGTIVVERRSE